MRQQRIENGGETRKPKTSGAGPRSCLHKLPLLIDREIGRAYSKRCVLSTEKQTMRGIAYTFSQRCFVGTTSQQTVQHNPARRQLVVKEGLVDVEDENTDNKRNNTFKFYQQQLDSHLDGNIRTLYSATSDIQTDI